MTTTAPDYLDTQLPLDRRVEDLLARMTNAEKAGLMFHPANVIAPDGGVLTADDPVAGARSTEEVIGRRGIRHFNLFNGNGARQIAHWHNQLQAVAADTRLAIPVTVSTDPRHSVRSTPATGMTITALSRWPETTGIAAIGDPEWARIFGDAIRQELRAMGIRVYLGPMADIFSDPRWSRGYGTFGEDPDLVTRMTAAFITGLHGGSTVGIDSVAAMVKHFPGAGPQLRGRDAHDPRYREQVYPGGQQELHLRPFDAAFAAGAGQVMTYYGMPVGTDWEEVGFAFNRPVVRDLLRGRYHFDGIVCTDWNVVDGTMLDGSPFGPNGWGMEDATPSERMARALQAGVDQFGGDDCVDVLTELVDSGRVPVERIDDSARRLLREKFRMGLFENRYVDVDRAEEIVGSDEVRSRGEQAQRRSLVPLARDEHRAAGIDRPALTSSTKLYVEGVDAAGIADLVEVVSDPDAADVALVRLSAPFDPPSTPLEEWFHSGTLAFGAGEIDRLRALAERLPVIVAVYLERPAILADLLPFAAVLIGEFGTSDRVLVRELLDGDELTGMLPFDIPASMAAVEASREDVPFDTAAPTFRAGWRLGRE